MTGRIGRGILALIGVQRGDSEAQAEHLLRRLVGYRIFPDAGGRMNLSLRDVGAELLLVPQFTLAADTHKGTRPGFSTAAPPDEGARLFGYLFDLARQSDQLTGQSVAAGRFGAHMQVALVNDGPVTFWLQTGSATESS